NAVNGIAQFTDAGLKGGSGSYSLTYSSGTLAGAEQNIILEAAPVPLITGTTPSSNGKGQASTVSLVDPVTGKMTGTTEPFPGFTGELRVTGGDVNGDGVAEIVVAVGPGGGPAVNILDSKTGKSIGAFFAYDPAFTGGVYINCTDVNNDGVADIITGAGSGGGPHVKIFNGKTLQEIGSFFAYEQTFTGGVSVASADINGDGAVDLVTGAGPGGGPHVKVFDGASLSLISQWFAYPADFTGGVFVGMGDIGNDGQFEVITGAGKGGGPVVGVFNPFTGQKFTQFFAYESAFIGGVRVGVSDVNGDGVNDLVTGAGPGGGPHVKAFNYPQLDLLFEFYSGPVTDDGGIFVS
ncbi:MAG: VCBS repeat-containing protein, partial [Gemmataceae bacterium]|nr:VCBS repeat-containing protein [Gemmataceae bacterium]